MSLPLEATNLTITGRLHASDLQLQPGTVTALIGPNGSGKTSLLRALSGVEVSTGTVKVNGEELWRASPSRRRRLLSFLPAARDIVWPIPVRHVIALGLEGPDHDRVDELIADLELQELADQPVDRLSTGERARVLLGRALAAKPAVLVLDEPLSNLDPYWVLRTLGLLRNAVADEGAAIIALHDLSLLGRFDRAILMNQGDMVLDGAP